MVSVAISMDAKLFVINILRMMHHNSAGVLESLQPCPNAPMLQLGILVP